MWEVLQHSSNSGYDPFLGNFKRMPLGKRFGLHDDVIVGIEAF